MKRLCKISWVLLFVLLHSSLYSTAMAALLDQGVPFLNIDPALFTWEPKAEHFSYEKIHENNIYFMPVFVSPKELQMSLDDIEETIGQDCIDYSGQSLIGQLYVVKHCLL